MSNLLQPHGLKHTRLPCLSPSLRVYSNSCALSQWCCPTVSSSVAPFSSCLQSFPASGSFLMSQPLASGGLRIQASASVLPLNIQDEFPLGLAGLISSLSKALLRIFSSTRVSQYWFFDYSILWCTSVMYLDFTFSSLHRVPKAFATSWVGGASFVLMRWPWVSHR